MHEVTGMDLEGVKKIRGFQAIICLFLPKIGMKLTNFFNKRNPLPPNEDEFTQGQKFVLTHED